MFKSWPWDNASASNRDRASNADDFSFWYDKLAGGSNESGSGIFVPNSNYCQVVAKSGLTVTMKYGFGVTQGKFFETDKDKADTDITLEAAGTLPYIARIVIRKTVQGRWHDIVVIKGAPASVPKPPNILRNADFFDLAIADITLAANTTTVADKNIVDLRSNIELCGFVKPIWGRIDTNTLYSDYKAYLEELRTLIADVVDGSAYMLKAQYDTDSDGVVDNSKALNGKKDTAFATAAQGAKADKALSVANFQSYNNVSTIEHWTGKYHLDGKKIYEKTISITGGNGDTGYLHGVNNIGELKTFVFSKSYIWYDPPNNVSAPLVRTMFQRDLTRYSISVSYITGNNISLVWGSEANFRLMTGYVTIQYTCTDR